MPTPIAFREWDYKGKLVRTVVDDGGGIHIVVGDIHRILEPEDYDRTPSGLDGHESRPLVVHPDQMTLVGVSGIKVLLRDSRKPEAEPLLKWLESVVMPALHGCDRHGKGPKANDPILSGLKSLNRLRASQVARERHSTALAKAVNRGQEAMHALTSLAGDKSIDDLMAWCRGQANVTPAADSGATTASSSEEVLSPPIGEASRASASETSVRPFDVIDSTSDEGSNEADVPSPKVRPAMIPLGEKPAPPARPGKPAGPVAALADDDEINSIDTGRPARARRAALEFEEPPPPRRAPGTGTYDERLKALKSATLGNYRRKD
jgi:prophage antirepressor-like protein